VLYETLDQVQDLGGKRILFRQLFGLLDQMETGLRSTGWKVLTRYQGD
jgi:hypothetical protein